MSRRVLLAGVPADLRTRLAGALDAAFDVDIEEHADALAVLGVLPNRTYDLFVVLARGETTAGLDLLRFVSQHAIHGGTPAIFVGGGPTDRQAALGLGARLMSADSSEDDLRRGVRDLLGLG